MKKQQKASQYTLKPSEVKKLIYNCSSSRNRCMIKLMAYMGLRREEVVKLEIPNIDFERGYLTVLGKGNKQRTIPFIGDIAIDLKSEVNSKKTGYVFLAIKKQGYLAIPHVNIIVRNAGLKAGLTNPNPRLKYINPHILRHSTARLLKDKGVRIDIIQQILGHASIKTTMDTYGTPSMEDMKKEIDEKVQI